MTPSPSKINIANSADNAARKNAKRAPPQRRPTMPAQSFGLTRRLPKEQTAAGDGRSRIVPLGRAGREPPESGPIRGRVRPAHRTLGCAASPSGGAKVAAKNSFGVGKECGVVEFGCLMNRNGYRGPALGGADQDIISRLRAIFQRPGDLAVLALHELAHFEKTLDAVLGRDGILHLVETVLAHCGKDPPAIGDPIALGVPANPEPCSASASVDVGGRSVGLSALVKAMSSVGYQKNSKCLLAAMRASSVARQASSGSRRTCSCNRYSGKSRNRTDVMTPSDPNET